MFSASKALSGLLSLTGAVLAASFPPTPENMTGANSTNFPGALVTWKETHICETTEGTHSYSGYVHLPPNDKRPYPINTFFWFFGARKDPETAPFSLWLSGGPGAPSTAAALHENGPCHVNLDSQTTSLNPWSWNDRVNMLYIDQPVQVGFSYDVLINGTINEIKNPFIVTPFEEEVPETNITTLTGTFASQNVTNAPVTTDMAAIAIWEMMQVWLESFEPYTPVDNTISIWAQSYGGHYAPTYASYFKEQNARIEGEELDEESTLKINLDTVGLINACVDMETQLPFYPQMACNNTYGIQAITEEEYQASLDAWPQCRSLTRTCRSMAEKMDPQGYGNVSDVNDACYYAFDWCFSKIQYPFERSGLYHFDIQDRVPGSFPPKLAAGYLNQADVQQALGVPVNFTGLSAAVATGFNVSGDFVKGHNLAHLGELLDEGVKVALVYGDADYQCNWYGGEALSLAIESDVQSSFARAGYADIQTNESYVGGVVRQHGNLTFSRVYNAGHEAPSYQPETAYQIFNRVMFNQDVATGALSTTSSSYSSTGPSSVANITNEPGPPHERYCYLWDMLETCMPDEYGIVMSGRAIVKDFILLGYEGENGTEVWLLEGTRVGEEVMMGLEGSGSGNGTNGSALGEEGGGQSEQASGNVAATMASRDISGMILLIVAAKLLL